MNDAHTPLLASFTLSDKEEGAVALALELEHPWDHKCEELQGVRNLLKSVKDKLADFHMKRQNETCCYCRTMLAGSFQRDREHILPKGKFPDLAYDPANLSVSCKRCNMEYKKERTDFVDDIDTIASAYKNSNRYLMVHPNFDRWEDYLSRYAVQSGADHLVFYEVDAAEPKAVFTFEFFELQKLTVSSFDTGQGLDKAREIIDTIAEKVPDRI